MKTKQILLTIALLFFSLFINAQDKYEFLIISYTTDYGHLTVLLNGKEITRENIELPKDIRGKDNANPLLLKVNEYQDKDWEVMSFDVATSNIGSSNSQSQIYFAFLRKKRADKK
jgi:hypothetical protein